MDMSQLTTIVITMAVTVISKEVFTWAWALLKTIVATDTIKAKLKATFSRSNLRIFFDLVTIAIFLYPIYFLGWTDSPID